jgi:hypothetical protein
MQVVALSVASLAVFCAGITRFRRQVKLHTFGSGLAAGNSFQRLNSPSVIDLTNRMAMHKLERLGGAGINQGRRPGRHSNDHPQQKWRWQQHPPSSHSKNAHDAAAGFVRQTSGMLVRALSSSEALLPENLHEAIEGLSAEGFRRRTTQATHKAKSKLGEHVFRSRELSSSRGGMSMTALSEAVPEPLTDAVRAQLQAQDSRGLDFSGHWRADKKRSSSLDLHLEALGVPWIARAVATNSTYNAHIKHRGLWWLESSTTAIVTTEQEMRLDGRPQSEPHPMDKSECFCQTTIEPMKPGSPKSFSHYSGDARLRRWQNRDGSSSTDQDRTRSFSEPAERGEGTAKAALPPQPLPPPPLPPPLQPPLPPTIDSPVRREGKAADSVIVEGVGLRLRVVTRTTYLKHGHTQVVSRWLEDDGNTYVVSNDLNIAGKGIILRAVLYFNRVQVQGGGGGGGGGGG